MARRILQVFVLMLVISTLGTAAECALVLSNYHISGTIWDMDLIGSHSFSWSGFRSQDGVVSSPNGDGSYNYLTLQPNSYFIPNATVGSQWYGTVSFSWTGLAVPPSGCSYFTLRNSLNNSPSIGWYATTSSGSATMGVGSEFMGNSSWFRYTSALQLIPEPSSIIALAVGLIGLVRIRRRKA